MTNKTRDWQENDKDILSQFPDSPAPELLALRQEPDWALKSQILSIPKEEQAAAKRPQWTFSGGLLNQLAGAAVLTLLLVTLGFWIFTISTNNVPATTQPESAAPVSTIRPTATSTRDLSFLSPSNVIKATPTETGDCPVTPFLQGDPGVEELGLGSYFINESRTIWANRPRSWQTGGEKVLWIKPAGSELVIRGRLLNQENSPPLDVALPCCYDGGFQITALIFPIPGCWEVTAEAGGETLQFVTEVAESEGKAFTGLALLEYDLSSTAPAANEPLTLTLNWQAGGADAVEMLVVTQFMDSNDNIVLQNHETIPSGVWTTQQVTTTHTLKIPEQAGRYTLRLLLTNNETFVCVPFYYNDVLVFSGFVTLDWLEIMVE